MLKTYKQFAILLSLILTTVSGVGQPVVIPSDREDFHIYLLMGQSNMSGNAVLTGMDTQTDPRILRLNRGNGWEIAKDPISPLYNPAVGPGMAFAKRLIEEKPGITVGLISTAMGGTKISQWERGSALYDSTRWRAGEASKHGVIKGILWHQGEHDAIYGSDATVYGQKLQLLIDNLRMDLGNPDLPFIVGGFAPKILKNKNHVWADTVWNRLKWVGENVHMAAYVPTYEVDELGDNLHFSASGQRQMGMRYANAMMALDGTWLLAMRNMLTEQSEDLGDGWKSHPIYGIYYDKNLYHERFPLIKHAQLGWVRLSVNADQIVQLESTDYGKINVSRESWSGGFYLHREVEDPELRPYQRGDEFYVNVAADENEPRKFYNHTINEWVSTIDNAPEYETILDYYLRAERQFGKTQELVLQTQISANEGNWSATRKNLIDAELSHNLTVLYGEEAWQIIGESKISRQDGDVWRGRVLDLLSRITAVYQVAEQRYIDLVSSGAPRLPPPPSGEVTPDPNPNPNPDVEPEDPIVDPTIGTSWDNPIVLGEKSARDAFGWPQTIVLSAVTTGEVSIYPGRERFSFPCSKPTEWKEMDIDPSAKVNLAVGNFWVIQKIGEKFYAITADYFRKNQFFNQWAPQVFSEKLPPDSPDSSNLAPMYYKKGETYGFMVTTVALNTYRTTNERSNIVLFQMP